MSFLPSDEKREGRSVAMKTIKIRKILGATMKPMNDSTHCRI